MATSLKPFSDADQAAIDSALKAARGKTSSRIEAVVVESCSEYERAADILGLFCALLAAISLLIIYPDARPPLYWVIFLQLIGFLFGTLILGRIDALRFILSGRAVLSRRVRHRATECFSGLGMAAGNPDSKGILIFCALFERQIVILASPEITAKIRPEVWGEIRNQLLLGLREGNTGAGWSQALENCGKALDADFPKADGAGD